MPKIQQRPFSITFFGLAGVITDLIERFADEEDTR